MFYRNFLKVVTYNIRRERNFNNFKISRYLFTAEEKNSEYNNKNIEKIIKNGIFGALLGTLLFYMGKEKNAFVKYQINVDCSTKAYTVEEVSKHKTKENGVWVTYQGKVYDITEFVDQHPGGDKIYLAAGGAIEPFWSLYAVHKENEEVIKILKQYEIGTLIEDPNKKKEPCLDDPFKNDPLRHPALTIVNHQPFNAETPLELLTEKFLTPNPIFFVRNHLPVPVIEIENFKLSIEGIGITDSSIDLTINNIKKEQPITKIQSTIMCAGNRRKDMSNYKPVKGLSWGQGAISTAEWTGIKLTDLFNKYSLSHELLSKMGAKHIQFVGMDADITGSRYGSSIPIEIALDPQSEILLAYEMNGEELPLDHGYPLRVIMPGIIGARQVKWLTKIIISDKESDSFWQQHDYKTFFPNVDINKLDYASVPCIIEPNVQSAICVPRDGQRIRNEGSVTVKGYAWSGGGRGIIRIEVSNDGGNTWFLATMTDYKEEPTSSHINRKQWSWVLWEVEIPVNENQEVMEILCKAVDSSQNTQPESYNGIWNVRGLMSNAWHRIRITLYDD